MKMNKKYRSDQYFPYLLILPTVLLIVLFMFYPITQVVNLSLQDYSTNSFSGVGNFIGLENFKKLLTGDKVFSKAFGVSLKWVVAVSYTHLMKTGKPAKIIYSRYESQIASSPRHEMEVKVKLGCDDNGILQAMDVYTLSNTGAFGEHGPTTVGLSGHKSIPMYGTPKAFRFAYDVVYTNRMSADVYKRQPMGKTVIMWIRKIKKNCWICLTGEVLPPVIMRSTMEKTWSL